MANILTISDFIGEFKLPTGEHVDSDLTLIITQVQEDYLLSLLGYTLKTSFEAGIGDTGVYDALNDGDTYGNTPSIYKYKGIKEMLKYFTYYEWMKFAEISNTPLGYRRAESTNSVESGIKGAELARLIYNKGIKIYCDTNRYIADKNSPTEVYADQLFTPKEIIGIL